ncbi:site-specific integrase [Sphingomonas sp. R86521]|uniref:site-specific integrase n=1 Tax=Sphingomonas sp. R86521 TaxID=3093860 RepID=UPI0036D3755C
MDELGKDQNLERRGAVYRCRLRCPQHLIRENVPVEKSVSLHTKERSVALERLPAARLALMEFFQRGGERPGAPSGIASSVPRAHRPDHPDLPFLTAIEAKSIATDYFRTAFAELDLASADLIGMSPDRLEQWLIELEDRIAGLGHGSEGTEDPAISVEIFLLRREGRRSPYASEPSRLLRGYVRRALGQLWRIELDRARGDFRDRITDALFRAARDGPVALPPTVAMPAPVALLRTVRATFEQSEIDGDDAITPKTRLKKKAALALIERHFGPNCDLASLTGSHCRAFRDLVARLPPNLTKRYQDDVLLGALADENEAAGRPCMSYATQGVYLRLLANLLAFGKSEGLMLTNPFPPELSPRGKKGAREKARNSYSDDQLRAIFTSPLYTSDLDDGRQHTQRLPGNVARRSRFWLPLIALFSGLRMNEILQLTRWHIQTATDGLPAFMIGGDMSVKTKASYRVVPVHRELIRCGLISYVAKLADDNALLFDDVPAGSDGYASSTFSKRYAHFWKSLGATEPDRKVGFHSFRHNFRDALRVPGADEALVKELGGWSRGSSVSNSYGDGARAAVLRSLLDAVSYNVDFSALHVS